MNFQTKVDNKRISSSEDIVETIMIIWTLTATLTLKIANQLFCMTLWPMMVHHHTKFGCERFSSWEDNWKFEPFLWPWPQQSNPTFSHDNPAYDHVPSKFSCKRISSSEDISEYHVFKIWSFTVTLTLKTANHLTVKTANQSLRKIIWLKMMHHHNKFVCKRYSDSDGMIWTNIHNILKFCCELGREHKNPISQ